MHHRIDDDVASPSRTQPCEPGEARLSIHDTLFMPARDGSGMCTSYVGEIRKTAISSALILARCSGLAGDVQDGVGVVRGFLGQAFESLRGGQNDQFNPSLVSFTLHIVHDWKGAVESVANDQLTALPGNLLFSGERRVAKLVAEFFGGLLLPFLDLAPIDDDVVLVRLAANLDRAERAISDTHRSLD